MSKAERQAKKRLAPGKVTAYKVKREPPTLVHASRFPVQADLDAFSQASTDERLEALSYLRYVKARDSGSSTTPATAVALSVLATGMTLIVAQTTVGNVWAQMGVFIAVLFLFLGALAVLVLVNGDRIDERRAWSEAWLSALEPLYSPPVAKASFFAGWRR